MGLSLLVLLPDKLVQVRGEVKPLVLDETPPGWHDVDAQVLGKKPAILSREIRS